MSDDLAENVAAVLGEHSYDTGWRCACDWTGTADEYDVHLAAAVLPLIREREVAARLDALQALVIRADQGIEFGPDNFARLYRMVREVAVTNPNTGSEGA